jgi:hypothetical protein
MPTDVEVPIAVMEAHDLYLEDSPSAIGDYALLEPIHQSNGGGVYRAFQSPDSVPTVLKEARPHAGLDLRGRDAVERLGSEHAALEVLAREGIAPRPIRRFTAWEHEYVEQEYLDYPTLAKWRTANFPFSFYGKPSKSIARYVAMATTICEHIIEGIDAAHAVGTVLGDIHPGNIMVAGDLSVRFIDLEDGRSPDSNDGSTFNALGFLPPESLSPFEGDWFSAVRAMLTLFSADTLVELVSPAYWDLMLERVAQRFGSDAATLIEDTSVKHVPRGPLEYPLAPSDAPITGKDLLPAWDGKPETRLAWRDAIWYGIQRSRRKIPGQLYSGDVRQHEEFGHINIVSGAAGVIMSAARSGLPIRQRDINWLADHTVQATKRQRPSAGLFDGIAGIVAALSEIGLTDLGSDLMAVACANTYSTNRCDLASGVSGTGLGMLAHGMETGNQALVDFAIGIGDALEDRLLEPDGQAALRLSRIAGLLTGWSGVAVFWTALAKAGVRTAHFSELVHLAITRDLANTEVDENGALGAIDRAGSRSLPYLAAGAAGVLVGASAVRGLVGYEDAFRESWLAMVTACSSDTYVFSGFNQGRSGIVAALAVAAPWTPQATGLIQTHFDALRDRALKWRSSLQFPGDYCLRLSSDFGTGAAGILSAATAATMDAWNWMPIASPASHIAGDRCGQQ